MSTFKFPDRSTLKKRIALYYQNNRKTINENLGLIIAFLACAAALWSGYAAKQSLKLQQQSVEAQIKAMQLSERAFVLPKFNKLFKRPMSFEPSVNLEIQGHTPATEVWLTMVCFESESGASEATIRAAIKQENTAVRYATLSFPGDILEIDCQPVQVKTHPSILVAGDVEYKDIFGNTQHAEFCYEVMVSNAYSRNCLDFSPKFT